MLARLHLTPYQPDIVANNEIDHTVAVFELTCPLDSFHHLESARDSQMGNIFRSGLSWIVWRSPVNMTLVFWATIYHFYFSFVLIVTIIGGPRRFQRFPETSQAVYL